MPLRIFQRIKKLISEGESKHQIDEWAVVLDRSKAHLNLCALQGYRQAPFLEWAILSLDTSIRLAGRSAHNESMTYLEMSSQALEFAKQISESPLLYQELMNGDVRESYELLACLERSMAHIEASLDSLSEYLEEKSERRLQCARLWLGDAVLCTLPELEEKAAKESYH